MKISLFLQLANFFVRHTYFGSRELHFKPKFDPQTVQELDINICAVRAAHRARTQGQTSFQGILFFLYSGLFFLFHILILAQETYNLSPSLTL